MKVTSNNQRGFTLIEVLVALVIIAIAFTAVLKTEGANTRDVTYIQDKTVANWVADNVMTKIQLGVIKAKAPATLSNNTTMLGKKWYWQAEVNSTSDNYVNKIIVNVRHQADAEPLVTLTGFSNTGLPKVKPNENNQ